MTDEDRAAFNAKRQAKERARSKRRRSDPDFVAYMRGKLLARLYGLTLERFNEMLEKQGHACKICRTPFDPNDTRCHSTDHDHAMGSVVEAVRGILCFKCNAALGGFGDSEELLLRAVEYLREHRAKIAEFVANGAIFSKPIIKVKRPYDIRLGRGSRAAPGTRARAAAHVVAPVRAKRKKPKRRRRSSSLDLI